MPDVVISQPAVTAVPAEYKIAGAQDFELLSVQATLDGSGAGGNFLPVLELVNPAGQVMASIPAASVTAGASAEVSWFPGLGVPPTGTGIFYDIANSGANLDVSATGEIHLISNSAGNTAQVFLQNDGTLRLKSEGLMFMESFSGAIDIVSDNGSVVLSGKTGVIVPATATQFAVSSATIVLGLTTSACAIQGSTLGFYGIAPVAQAAHPTTLADVITLLQRVGLCA